jgi:hypothetical protein
MFFEYTDGQMVDLGEGSASAINNLGQAVGYNGYAALYSNGEVQDLDKLIDPSLGITLGDAVAINDKDQIVTSDLNRNKSYLLTPVPEPSTWALTACSLLLLAAYALNRSIALGRT